MKTATLSIATLVLCIILAAGCAQKKSTSWESIKNPEVVAQLKSFVAEKEAQAMMAARADGKGMPLEYKKIFTAGEKGDWSTISNMFWEMGKRTGAQESSGPVDLSFRGTRWEAAKAIWGAFDQFCEGDEKYSTAFGDDIIKSIPAESIYFGGTDPGRFLITGMQKSQVKGEPFFTLTQNALADGSYLDYLRSMYGGRIYIPTAEDSQKCFQNYMEDVAQRRSRNQLKPGEDVHTDENGRVQVSGQVAVMEINGLLVKIVFDKNPDREFYIEESFPFDWMYPYLGPHGLIFKINREPLPTLADEILDRDHDYWTKLMQPMIGGWLHDDTSVAEVAAFAKKVFGKHDFSGFTGDPRFIQNAYSHRMFSKLRSSQAGAYAWRLDQAADEVEKDRMARAADLAFRQAWALCPDSPEAVFRYVNFLMKQKRISDALVVGETAAQMPPKQGGETEQFRMLVEQLKKIQNKSSESPEK